MWQVLYEELKHKNFVILGIALDTGGAKAARGTIRPEGLGALPPELQRLMGWDDALWQKAATPTYPCLIDERHRVAELYGMVNVPMAVWIDERGRIVRPAETAGFGDAFRSMDRATFAIEDAEAGAARHRRSVYADAIRDWVEKGDESMHALSPDEVRRRTRQPSDDDRRAAANFRLGEHLYRRGDLARAQAFLDEAVRLHPENWSYRRQSFMLEPGKVGELNAGPEFWEAIDRLGGNHYYPPIEMEGIPNK